MRRRSFILTAAITGMTRLAGAATQPAGEDRGRQPVVLELFTSQGCSSCPPADALLGELARQPGVIALAWHVDYWNDLGWRDPYATRLATDRQRAYAARLRDEVYTPALVVNGAAVVVGSDRSAVAAAMTRANTSTSVSLTLRRDALRLVAEIGATAGPLTALLAVYDPEAATAIGAGENGGRRLREYRIVRSVRTDALQAGPPRVLELPAVAPGQGAALLLQSTDLRVIAAADLPPG
jgi:hypothetical protein